MSPRFGGIPTGEYVEDTYAGPMERETIHFLEAIVNDTDVMVAPRDARR